MAIIAIVSVVSKDEEISVWDNERGHGIGYRHARDNDTVSNDLSPTNHDVVTRYPNNPFDQHTVKIRGLRSIKGNNLAIVQWAMNSGEEYRTSNR